MKSFCKFLTGMLMLSLCAGCSKNAEDKTESASTSVVDEIKEQEETIDMEEAIEKDLENAQMIATEFCIAVHDDLLTYGTFTSVPEEITSLDEFPDSFCTPGKAEWSVSLDEGGVYLITLNGIEVWPESSSYIESMK